MTTPLQIGLAFGGGGARGMAHILVCEVFDELGIKPAAIAGTSIGAIIGAGYASGMSGRDMRERSIALYRNRREVMRRVWRSRSLSMSDLLRGRIWRAQLDPLLVLESLVPGFSELPDRIEDLEIPFKAVACDFYGWTETVLDQGPLKPAVAASIAIPSVFKPVLINGRIQIDGGAFNPLPFDHVADRDVVVASDVAGGPGGDPDRVPGILEMVIGTAQVSMQAITAEKLKWHQPDILIRHDTTGIFVLDFLKTERILSMNEACKDDLKRRLELVVESPFLKDQDRLELTS